jgi:hypothetical protein
MWGVVVVAAVAAVVVAAVVVVAALEESAALPSACRLQLRNTINSFLPLKAKVKDTHKTYRHET